MFRTKKRYPLYLVGERCSPWLVLEENEGHHVRGQVFLVDGEGMQEMDALERINDPDGYRKVHIPVVSEETGEEMLVYAYIKPVEHLKLAWIRLGPIEDYELQHASLYRSRRAE